MNYCKLSIKEVWFLTSLLECGSSNRQTALQLLAAEHLYIPTLLPKLRDYARRLKQAEELGIAVQPEATFDDYCRAHPEDQCCREYDV